MKALTLPYPVSANRNWMHYGNHVFVSEQSRSYRDLVGWTLRSLNIQPLNGDVVLAIDVYRPRKRGDLDNTLKVLLDAMSGHVYEDDKQVVEIRARRFDDKRNPRVEVRVTRKRNRVNAADARPAGPKGG